MDEWAEVKVGTDPSQQGGGSSVTSGLEAALDFPFLFL